MPELIERYLAELERRLPGRRRSKRRAIAEASRHLHDAYADEQAAGLDEQAAEQRAIDRFGPARDVADAFRTSLPVRHVTTRRVAALVTAGLAAALIATIVQETSTPDSTPRTPQAEAAASAKMRSAGHGEASSAPAASASVGSGGPQDGLAAKPASVSSSGDWGFSAWVAGSPGESAGAAVRRRFRERSDRSARPLSEDARVTRVGSIAVDRLTYEVFGVRDGDLVCLEVTTSTGGRRGFDCTTWSGLMAGPTYWTLLADQRFPADREPDRRRRSLGVTVGFVPDGVRTVEVVRNDGSSRARVLHNVFIGVWDGRPATRVRRVEMVDATGRRRVAPARSAGLALPPRGRPAAKTGGPTRVDRFPESGTIAWLRDGEQRGTPLPEGWLPGATHGGVFAPNPLSPDVVVLYRRDPGKPDRYRGVSPDQERENADLCVALGQPAWRDPALVDCGTAPGSPFIGFQSMYVSATTVTTVGAVTDDVARLELYTGPEPREIPITDNGVLLEIHDPTAPFPYKLVAYDASGQVIGIIPEQPDFGTSRERPDETQRRTLIDVSDEVGSTARIDVAPSNLGGTCWWLLLGRRTSTRCVEHGSTDERSMPPLGDLYPERLHGRIVLLGRPLPQVARLTVRLRDGHTQPIPIVEGFVLAALPAAVRDPGDGVVIGRDSRGNELARFDAATRTPIWQIPARPPLQQAKENGVRIRIYPGPTTSDAHALVQIDTRAIPPEIRTAIQFKHTKPPEYTLVCFGNTAGQAEPDGYGIYAPLGRVSVIPLKIQPPFDACELPGANAKTWRDRWNGRGVVELPLTQAGRDFFEERAAVRDLALFVRTPTMRAFRAARGPAPASDALAHRFANGAVVPLDTPNATPPAGKVGVWTAGTRILAIELAPTGERLFVQLDKGRIADSNIRGRTHLR